MIRLLCSIVVFLCLIAAGFLLCQSPDFPERLPHGIAHWIPAVLELFRHPVAAGAILSLSLLLAIAAACVTELLLGWLFSLLAAVLALACLLAVLGDRFPAFGDYLEKLFS